MDEEAKELLRQEMEHKYGPFNSRFCGLRQIVAFAEYNKRIYFYKTITNNYREFTYINTKPDDTPPTPLQKNIIEFLRSNEYK
jgi:hypothetical protein